MLSKALSTSRKRAALHATVPDLAEFCQQLYPLLLAHADDFGRLSGDAFTVKHAVDPTSPRPLSDFGRALQAIHNVRLIAWYPIDDPKFVQIINFEAHQVGLHKRTASKFPEPPEKFPEIPPELKGTEQKRTKASPEPHGDSGQTTASPTFLEFPTVGSGGLVWALSEAQVADWMRLFPGLDVRQEARKALAWVIANPGRRKTAGGMPRFLVIWLTKSNDRGGSRVETVPPATPDDRQMQRNSARYKGNNGTPVPMERK